MWIWLPASQLRPKKHSCGCSFQMHVGVSNWLLHPKLCSFSNQTTSTFWQISLDNLKGNLRIQNPAVWAAVDAKRQEEETSWETTRQRQPRAEKGNREGRHAWETRRQRQPRAAQKTKSWRETQPTRKIMKGDTLGRQEEQPRKEITQRDTLARQGSSQEEIMKGDTLGRQGSSQEQKGNHEGQQQPRIESMKGSKLGRQGGSGSQEQPRREIMGDRRQRQPRAAQKGNRERRHAWETRQRKSSPETKNHEGRQAWETRRQEQPRREITKGDLSLGDKAAVAKSSPDKAAAAAKSSPEGKSWRETILGDKAAAATKSSPEGKSRRETCLGDKAAATSSPYGDFGNQQPSHWEVRTPIASSFLGIAHAKLIRNWSQELHLDQPFRAPTLPN